MVMQAILLCAGAWQHLPADDVAKRQQCWDADPRRTQPACSHLDPAPSAYEHSDVLAIAAAAEETMEQARPMTDQGYAGSCPRCWLCC